MTPARALSIAMLALAVLIGARPGAEAQFPRGLLAAAEPRATQWCTIDTRPLSFGVYDPLAETTLDAVGQIIYTCGSGNQPGTRQDNKAIRIEIARGWSNAYSFRAMSGPDPGGLEYNIYLDATHRTIWGDGTSGTEFYYDAKPPNRTPVAVPAFGRINARQDVEAGSYVDIPAVRILF